MPRRSPLLLLPTLLLLTVVPSRELEGSLVVRLKGGEIGREAALAAGQAGWRRLSHVGMFVVESEDDPLLAGLQSEGAVEFAEADAPIELARLPNDPLFGDQDPIFGEEGIGLIPVWDRATGDAAVTVAIIDTGIDLAHPDLADNVWVNGREIPDNGEDDDRNGYVDDAQGYDFFDSDPDPSDENGHGTHLAGVIGAVGDNGTGMAGINWEIGLMPLKFTDPDGVGRTSLAVEAIDYAIAHGAQVINASWNVKEGEEGWEGLRPLRTAIERAAESGVIFVTAAGNGGGRDTDQEPAYPASFGLPNLISVASVDSEGGLASFSNFGKGSVHLGAPGQGVLSTFPGARYGLMNGTSVSTAFVSGAAALLLAVDPTRTPSELREALIRGSSPEEGLKGLVASNGRLNLSRAVAQLQSTPQTDASRSFEPVRSSTKVSSGGCSLIQ